MKKIFFFLIVIAMLSKASACPFCGCGGGNLYMGLVPDFQHQFFGMRYNYSEYRTVLASDTSQHSKNYYNTLELWYGIHVTSKLQIMAFVPYNLNKQVDDDGITSKNGLGDISLIAQYSVFHKVHFQKKNHSVIEQQLWLGGGLKLPTGVFNANVNDSTTTLSDLNAQLGTGSVDFLLNGLYSFRAGNFGVNLNATYKINTMHDDVKFGNKLNINTIAYYHINTGKKSSINPNAGLNYENVSSSTLPEQLKTYIPYTNSQVMTATGGIEYNINKVGIGVNVQLPVEQNFANYQTSLKVKTMAHITLAI